MADEQGDRYRLKEHHGHDAEGTTDEDVKLHENGLGHLSFRHPLLAGQIGTVDEVIPNGTAGHGDHGGESVVLAFDHLTYDFSDRHDPKGKVAKEHGIRRVSFTRQQLADLFEPLD